MGLKDNLLNALLGTQGNTTQFQNTSNDDEFVKALLSSPNATELLSKGVDAKELGEQAKQGLNMGQPWIADLQKQYGINTPKTEEEINQARLGTFNTPIMSSGVSQAPRQGGFINDFMSGAVENARDSFNPQNLEPNGKGFAYKLGEGLGTATRLLDTPLARGLISAGLVNMVGGTPETMLKEGLTGAVGRQNARTNNQLYRKQLEALGLKPDDVTGNINDSTFKNLITAINQYNMSNYRNRKLDKDSYLKATGQISQMLNNGEISPEQAKALLQKANEEFVFSNIENMQQSNQSRNANVNEYLAPAKAYALRTAPMVAMGNLAVNQARLQNQLDNSEIDNALKVARINEIQNNIENKANQNPLNSLNAIKDQMDRFTNSFGNVSKDKLGAITSEYKTKAGFGNNAEVNFNSQKQLLFNKIARELGGEKGVLSDQDIKRIQEALPNLSDSYQQKRAKMQAVYNLLGDRINQVQPRQTNGVQQVGKYKVRVK